MRRKDWISIIALLLIIAIASLGEFISAQGNPAITIGNLWYFIPMIILLVSAVLMGRRKGNHASLFKWLSWTSYGLSLFFLFCSVDSFMHFFNAQDSSKKEALIKYRLGDFRYLKYAPSVQRRRGQTSSGLPT